MWSNFWGAVASDGFYARSPDYSDIVQGSIRWAELEVGLCVRECSSLMTGACDGLFIVYCDNCDESDGVWR